MKYKKLISKYLLSTYYIPGTTHELMGVLRIRQDLCSQGTHGPSGEEINLQSNSKRFYRSEWCD